MIIKRLFLFSFLCLSGHTFGADLFSKEGALQSKPLEELLALTDIDHKSTLESIVEATQEDWCVENGYWVHPQDVPNWDSVTCGKILSLVSALGYVQPLKPTHESYDVAVIVGGSKTAAKTRLKHLIRLWKAGTLKARRIVMLGSALPLEDEVLAETVKKSGFEGDESGLMRETYKELSCTMPADMKNTPVTWAHYGVPESTPEEVESWDDLEVALRGKELPPPTLDDTVSTWIAGPDFDLPKAAKVLVISNQPHAPRHRLVVEKVLAKKRAECAGALTVDVTAPISMLALYGKRAKAPPKEAMHLVLNAIARHLYALRVG